MTLSEKINYINRVVPFAKILYEIKGISVDSTQQIYCPFHQDINEKSARVYINNRQDGSDGLYCFKCGNFSAFKVVLESLDDNIPETLKWFEDRYNLDFKDSSAGNNRDAERIAELVSTCKKHSKTVKWSSIDVNRLALTIKKYKNDNLTDLRLNNIHRKLDEKSK